MKNTILAVVMCVLCAGMASASTWYVATNSASDGPGTAWSNAFHTIQGGVDAASNGDTVWVTNGVYDTGGAVVPGYELTNRARIGHGIAVLSVGGPSNTVIVGSGTPGASAVRCAYVGTNAFLSGFTLSNGCAQTSGSLFADWRGGGVWCRTGGTVSNCVVVGCCSGADGGGVWGGRYLSCTIADNESGLDGGGAAQAELDDCLLSGNRTMQEGARGGGACSSSLVDCRLAGNSSHGGGGAWDCDATGCLFESNSVTYYGGATYFGTLTNCVVRYNSALVAGGGCYHGTAVNCVLVGNQAGHHGGGAYNASLESCTVVGNRSLLEGGGIFEGDVLNSIVYYNDSTFSTNDNLVLSGSGTYSNTCATPLVPGIGNISDAPALQSLRVPRLVNSSPCIDAGTNAAWMATATDIEGDPRISGGTVDMGADEVVAGNQSGGMAVAIVADWADAVVGQPLRFEADIEGDVQGFTWDCGDSTSGNPDRCVLEHAYNHAGTFSVVLEASNKSGTAAATTTVSVVSSFTAYVSPTGGHVPPFGSWAEAATNIQTAVDACPPGGTVLVAEGEYSSGGRTMWGVVTNRIAVDHPVTVMASGSRKNTKILGPGTTNAAPLRCAMLCAGATLSGFTLSGGWVETATWQAEELDGSGAGVWSEPGGLVSNCTVSGNTAQGSGGGVMGGTVADSELSQNTALDYGGGAASATLSNCSVSGNHGSGIFDCTAHGCRIEANTGEDGGGADESTLEDCTVVGNSASDGGGGTSACTVRNCLLAGNRAVNDGGGDENSDLFGCVITGNSAFRGGGVFGGRDSVCCNCTIVGNKASGSGGGTCRAVVSNSIVYYNTAAMECDNVDILDGGSCDYTCTTPDPGGNHNITAAPRLSGFGVPHIGTYSPCINAGATQAWMAAETDFDGEPRIAGASVDMGADEYVGSALTGDPQANMLYDSDHAVAGFPLRFQADCHGKVAWLAWVWGDGTTNNGGAMLEHAFAAPGDYPVALRARNSETLDVMTVTVHVVEGYTNYVASTGSHAYPFASWATAATNIQSAVDANPYAGGVVLVADGSYETGGKTIADSIKNRVMINKVLTVKSQNGSAAATILGSAGTGSPVRCAYVGNRARLEGFALSGGRTEDDELYRFSHIVGAGAWCEPEGEVSHCVVIGCATTEKGFGGGLFQGLVSDSLIISNQADEGGGACHSTLSNCTVMDNTEGGGSTGDTLDCKLVNSIVEAANWWGFRTNMFQYSCLVSQSGGPKGPGGSSSPPGIASIEADPLFVDRAGDDYHLQSTSPCIDSGTNLTGIANDLDGRPRPLDGDNSGINTADMGCYEFASAVADSDGDTMADAWELGYGLDPTDPSDQSLNPDADPFNNREEFLADTDPTDPADWFHIVAIDTISNGAIREIWFDSSDQREYSLLRCENLLSNDWTALPAHEGSGGLDSLQDGTNAPMRFYKVRVGLPPE